MSLYHKVFSFIDMLLSIFLESAYQTQIVLEPIQGVLKYTLMTVDGKPVTFGKILVGLFFLTAGIYFSKIIIRVIINKFLDNVVESKAALHAIENISFYFMVAFFTLVALQVANIPITAISFLWGAVAIGFGLGSQNIMNNFMSGIILLIEQPVRIGDVVLINDDLYGRVEDIGMRATKVNSFENKHLIIPNSKLLEGNVKNWTHNSKRVKSKINVGVRYGSDVDAVKKCLIESSKECPATLKSREPLVIFKEFGDNSLKFVLYVEIKVQNLFDEQIICSQIRETIAKKFLENDIIIAYPQRDVHVHMSKEDNEKLKKKIS